MSSLTHLFVLIDLEALFLMMLFHFLAIPFLIHHRTFTYRNAKNTKAIPPSKPYNLPLNRFTAQFSDTYFINVYFNRYLSL